MKQKMRNDIDIKECEFLTKLTFSSGESKILWYFLTKEQVTARQLEQTCCIRQPEVSLILKKLLQLGFIKRDLCQPTSLKGRPQFSYIVRKKGELIDKMIQIAREKIEEYNQIIVKLREL